MEISWDENAICRIQTVFEMLSDAIERKLTSIKFLTNIRIKNYSIK